MEIKTGDFWIVDRWLERWPYDAVKAITEYIPDYQNVVKFRRSTTGPTVGNLKDSFQLVINHNCDKDCYIVWNAAVQSRIHEDAKKSISLSFGEELKEKLTHPIDSNGIVPVFQGIGRGGSQDVELVLIVGKDAIADFCKNYQEMIKPDIKQIPNGKRCLYAVAGGEIQYIPSER